MAADARRRDEGGELDLVLDRRRTVGPGSTPIATTNNKLDQIEGMALLSRFIDGYPWQTQREGATLAETLRAIPAGPG
jgi:hypothetical protein